MEEKKTEKVEEAPPTTPETTTVDVVQSVKELEDKPAEEPAKKRPFVFLRCIRALWATRYTEDVENNRELHIRTTLRELMVYSVFLILLSIITFGMTSQNSFFLTKAMTSLFVDSTVSGSSLSFRGITSINDFWKVAKDPLLRGLYWETWYNNDVLDAKDTGYIYYENKLLGLPRIRQLRVYTNSCKVHEDFENEIRDCYASYSLKLEDREVFGPKKDNDSAWMYQTRKALKGFYHWGKMAVYGGGGYIRDLETTTKDAKRTMDYLMEHKWVDRGTRIVFIDFSVYNANVNLFCAVRLAVEFPATGGAFPAWFFRTVKLIRYVTIFDKVILICEYIFLAFVVYYIVEEFLEIKKHKLSYFKAFWNVVDVVLLLIAILCITFNVYRTASVSSMLKELVTEPNKYANFEFLAYWQKQFNNVMAVAVFIAWAKIFKYISFNKTMTQLSLTLGRCASDLAGFAVMFFIVFLAFAQLGYLMFGTQMKDMSTFSDAIFTLFRIILGDFDFAELQNAHRILGPAYFILYVFFVFFVLLNMFLAIINDTYGVVKNEILQRSDDLAVVDYLIRGYKKVLNKMKFKRGKLIDMQNALQSADADADKQVDFDEWRKDLESRGYDKKEIEEMFSKYDKDGNRVLSEQEQNKMSEDLSSQRTALRKEIDDMESHISEQETTTASTGATTMGAVSYEEFTVLSRRVDRMEHSVSTIVSKIDAVLLKLEQVEKAKLKRRDVMGKILDTITKSDATSDAMKKDQMEKLIREELDRWESEDARFGKKSKK